MTDLETQVKRALELSEKATPGPWTKVSDLPDFGVAANNGPDPVVTLNRKYRAPHRRNLGCSELDAEFIAHCNPAFVKALCEDWLEQLEQLEIQRFRLADPRR